MTSSGELHHAHSWTVSLLCHALAAWCGLFLIAEIEKPVPLPPFTWEVSMVEAPQTVEPVPPAPSPPTPVPVQPRQVQRTVESRHTVETVETVPQQTRDVATPIEQSTATPVAAVIERPAVTALESPTAVTQEVAIQDAAPVEHAAVVEHQAVAAVSHPVQSRTEPVVEKETVSPGPDLPAVEHLAVQHRVVKYRRTQADYGWLRDALWKRIEELKRYPAMARTNHWEGKVVVLAVIRSDGTVGDVRVAESSGHALLDQEALVVMRKASPLTMKYQLEKPQITILVPISYRLDG